MTTNTHIAAQPTDVRAAVLFAKEQFSQFFKLMNAKEYKLAGLCVMEAETRLTALLVRQHHEQQPTDDDLNKLAEQHTWFNGSHAMTNYPAFARAVLKQYGAQALEAAPALDAQGERSGFPPRIMKLLLEVAEREGKGSRGPWEDGDGEPLQEDADAAISWIDHMASAPLPHAVGKPLSDELADAIQRASNVRRHLLDYVRSPTDQTAIELIKAVAHGIVTKESGT